MQPSNNNLLRSTGMACTARGIRPAWGLLLAVFCAVTAVDAATYSVTTLADVVANDTVCSLREAIQEANNGADTDCAGSPSSADDTITFSVSGTIVLGSTLPNIVSGQGTLTIDGSGQNVTIDGNGSVRILNVDPGADLTLRNLTASGGSTTVIGGGGILSAGTLTVIGCTIRNNVSAGDGGGILQSGGNLVVTNSTFFGNVSGSTGGAICSVSGTVEVINSTISGNFASVGSGIGLYGGSNATLKNTIVANNPGMTQCSGTLTSSSINNLFDNTNACGLVNGVNGNIVGFGPNLGPLTGSPAYFPLNPGSPAIDAGDNATCAAAPVNNQSQNGVIRPQDGNADSNAVCDIGSFEALPPVADMSAALGSLPPSFGPGSVYPGLSFSCTNSGPDPALNATCSIAASAGAVSNVVCTPSVPVASLAAGASISCTYSFTVPGTGGGGNTPETGVTFTVTAGANNDTNSSNNTASNVSPIPIVDALDDAASFPASTTQTFNVGANDQYGTGGLPGSASFTLLASTTCSGASITSPGGVATFQVPTSGTCVVAYRVCAGSGCDTAQLVVTAQQQLEPIPSLDQWGLAVLILLTLGVGVLLLKRVMA